MKHHFSPDTEEYLNTYIHILTNMNEEMTDAALTDSISQNFIRQMIPHHRAAIEMSQNLLRYTDNGTLRAIAENIISEQTRSIEDMRRIERSCAEYRNTRRELFVYQRQMERIIRIMLMQMENARAGERINCDFLREMIPHHMGAVRMSTLTKSSRICPELIPILDAIITSQRRGIIQMRQLERTIRCN